MEKKILVFNIIFLLICLNLNSQTIINTENMMSELKDDLSYNMSFQGDFNFGNIELMQFSTAHLKSQVEILLDYCSIMIILKKVMKS